MIVPPKRIYVPGKACLVEEQCPPRTITKKVWVPTVCEKQVECVRYERETIVEKQCYKVCTMVREQRVKTCTYTVPGTPPAVLRPAALCEIGRAHV